MVEDWVVLGIFICCTGAHAIRELSLYYGKGKR